jgi:hypothetical protein
MLRGAQASFLLNGTLLEIDPDAFAADHRAHVGSLATNTTAELLRGYVEPHLAAAGALAAATRANAGQIAELTLGSVAPPVPTTPTRCSSRPIRPGPRPRGTFRTGSSGSGGRPVCGSTPPPDGTATQPDLARPFTSSPPPR